MQRRTVLLASAAGLFGTVSWLKANNEAQPISTTKIMDNIDLQTEALPKQIKPWNLSKEQWAERLDETAFYVLRQEGTERPFTSVLNNEKRDGTYVCAGCGLALFESNKKFDSGTGWPSFFDIIEGHVETKRDFKLLLPRTEYHCARCQGHQGHVFNDGPQPTGLRYCNNGVAIKFIPA